MFALGIIYLNLIRYGFYLNVKHNLGSTERLLDNLEK